MNILFLDLDGTVRKPKSGSGFLKNPKDQEIIPGVNRAIAQYKSWYIVGVTNQGGVGAGHKSLLDCFNEQTYTLRLIPQIERIYFCPDLAGKECWVVEPDSYERVIEFEPRNYRKPGCGMIQAALGVLPSAKKILLVGDRTEDQECAQNAGIDFLWAEDWVG